MAQTGYLRLRHGNDPTHTAKVTSEWLEDNAVSTLGGPAQPPNLNPTEHLWNEADWRLCKLKQRLTSPEDLWGKMQDVWNGIEVEE